MNSYTEELRVKLSKTRAPVTVGSYIRRLTVLNGGQPIKSMKFLLQFDDIILKISEMDKSFSTKTSYLTAVSAVLSLYPKYSSLYKKYQTVMIKNANIIKEELGKNEKNDKQKESIIPMSDVIAIRDALKDTDKLAYLILSLYTMIPPRRNLDYSKMVVVFEEPDNMDANKNYYVASERQFIFNVYKTASTYGSQRKPVPEELAEVIDDYIASRREGPQEQDEFHLLVDSKGNKLNDINGITRILNKVFGKGISSGALRHIYLSDKFSANLKERKECADDMAHSLQMATEYQKTD